MKHIKTLLKLLLIITPICGHVGNYASAQESCFPVLNEIMSSNTITIQDEDKETSDWIELYNPGTDPVDMTGYGLTDDIDDPYKWVFPALTLYPHQLKIIFASGKDRKPNVRHWETVINWGDDWRYFVGHSEPPEQWMTNTFNDTSWPIGPSGFGFGDNDDATVISQSVPSVYIRTFFTVDDVNNISRCVLHMDYDDGFIAYINGKEVARANIGSPGIPVPYNQNADSATEAKIFHGENPEVFEIDNLGSVLVSGKNTLAIQTHNSYPSSSDMTVIPFLTFEMEIPPANPKGTPDILSFSIPFLHTNFKINKLGETITLFDPLGNTADQIEVSNIPVDFSLGRKPDGENNWVLFALPTPGTINSTEAFAGNSDPVDISLQEGFYNQSVALTLSCQTAAAEIRYTLDGTEPGRTSPIYSSPVTITKTTVLHARSFEDNKLPGPIATRTYIIGANPPETIIRNYFITCDPADFEYLYKNYFLDDYVPATLTYDGIQWPDVQLRIRGDDSRTLAKKSLKMKSNTAFANGRKTLNFNAEFLDRTYVQQYLSSHLMQNSGQPVFTADYARLYLNGEFLGLYLSVENVDEDFLKARDMDTHGNLYKATHDGSTLSVYDDIFSYWEKKSNTEEDWSDLIQLKNDLNTVPDEDYYGFVNETFDYDKMVNIIAMNMLLSNRSTYYHNYFLYHDIYGTKKWIMLPWDMDKTIGIYENNCSYQQSSNQGMPDNPILERALLDKRIFYDIRERIDDLTASIFNPGQLFPLIDSLRVVLKTSVEEDKSDNISSLVAWEYNLGKKYTYIQERNGNLKNQFAHWPRSFRVNPTPLPFSDAISLSWSPCEDPDNDPITYKILYSTSEKFEEAETTEIDGLADTTYTFSQMLPVGKYYWKVMATDGETWIEGYNSWNEMEVKNGTSLPATINGDVVLTADKSPYNISQNITIVPNSSLTVEAGVEMIFFSGESIVCKGELSINGTEEKPVVLRASASGGNWGALCFKNAVGTLTHCIIKNASTGGDPEAFPAAVSSGNSTLLIDSVRFDSNRKSIVADRGSIIVRNCVFADTNSEEHLILKNARGTIENNDFFHSRSNGAIVLKSVTDGIIENNIIHGSNNNGIDIGDECAGILISGNTIYDCADKGISIGETSRDITIGKTIIRDCSIAISVYDGSNVSIERTTFYGNNIAVAAYSGDHLKDGGSAVVCNTIFAVSHTSAVSYDDYSSVTVTYSLSDNELLPGEGNIMADPLFVLPGDNNFHLQQKSPAIDAGDPSSEPDPDNSVADMGANYYLLSNSTIIINEINYNSLDEAFSGDWVELYNPNTFSVDLSGWLLRDKDTSNSYIFPEGFLLNADCYIVLCQNTSAFLSIFPDVTNYAGELKFGLSGNGDSVILLDGNGEVVDSLVYDDKLPWPEECDGGGYSLSLINPKLDNERPENWAKSKGRGTPGKKNDVYQSIDEPDSITPTRANLMQNRPNPFNVKTIIDYMLTKENKVRIDVFNITGQRVAVLVDQYKTAGNYSVVFDASHLPSGVYVYRMEIGNIHKSKKMLLIK